MPAPNRQQDFRRVAVSLLERGWLSIPLTLDANGFAKKPITPNWTGLARTTETIESLPWAQAHGIGIVLGPASSNLAVLDIDDKGLAEALFTLYRNSPTATRTVSTARDRLHIYCTEREATRSRRFAVQWDGRDVTIELKTTGTQVAAPPSPGYQLLTSNSALAVPDVAKFWSVVSKMLTKYHPDRYRPAVAEEAGNYPAPWQGTVREGSRNDSIYIEAHKLREAGLSLDQAVEILSVRADGAYESGNFSRNEIQRTVQSAYRKGEKTDAGALNTLSRNHLLGRRG